MTAASFDPNNRALPWLQRIHLSSIEVDRVAKVALPFLALYRPTAVASTFILAGVKSWQHINNKELLQLCQTVSLLAVTILFPTLGAVLSHGKELQEEIFCFVQLSLQGDWKEASLVLGKIIQASIYLSSIIYASPELLAISLISQGAAELYQSHQEFKEGRYLEGLAHLLLAGLRFQGAAPHIETCRRNWLGKEFTQEDLEAFFLSQLEKCNNKPLVETPGESSLKVSGENLAELFDSNFKNNSLVVLETHLIEKNYSSKLKNLNFNVYYEGLVLTNIEFIDCAFNNTALFNSIIHQCTFNRCELKDTVFYSCLLNHVTILNSDLTKTCFNDSFLNIITIANSSLYETSFLHAYSNGLFLVNNDLTDCILADAKDNAVIIGGTPHRITRPVIGFSWNFKYPQTFARLERQALEEHGAIVLRHEYEPNDIDFFHLNDEVVEGLLKVQELPAGALSRADAILAAASPNSTIDYIKKKAEAVLNNADALLLPGGADIEPEFYLKDLNPEDWKGLDYRRSMIEFALLQQAHERNMPIMGICRGSQMGNVFFGGTLHQHVEGQMGALQNLHILDTSFFSKVGITEITGLSAHHQASNDIGTGLQVVMAYDGIPKALIGAEGRYIFTQFHPEFYLPFGEIKEKNFKDKKIVAFLAGIHPTVVVAERFFDYFLSLTEEQVA